jgi:hypothetical protein
MTGIFCQGGILYVDVSNTAPAAPYADWATASTSVFVAVNSAIDGDTVLIEDGSYMLNEMLIITQAIKLSGVHGAACTVLDAGGCRRCMYISNTAAVVEDISITGGGGDGNGAGILIESGGTLCHCIIRNNTCTNGYGAVYLNSGGTLFDCTVVSNAVSASGGGVYCYRWGSSATNCIIAYNTAGMDGGGACCFGAGSVLHNCVLRGNTAERKGGGVYIEAGGTVRNCLLYGNYVNANDGGGGAYVVSGSIESCTIARNESVSGDAAGVYFVDPSTLRNTIAYLNDGADWEHEYQFWSSHCLLENCCFDSLPSGDHIVTTNTITGDPCFLNYGLNDYRLTIESPCINSGSNHNWMAVALDMDGQLRIFDERVDIGADEAVIECISLEQGPVSMNSTWNVMQGGYYRLECQEGQGDCTWELVCTNTYRSQGGVETFYDPEERMAPVVYRLLWTRE